MGISVEARSVKRKDIMSSRELADKTAVVGVGSTNFGALYRDLDAERTPFDMGADAFVEAVSDCGLTRDDIDGVLVCGVPDYGRMCDVLGIRYPRFVNVMQAGGRQASLTLQFASLAVNAGLANYVACIYGNVGRSAGNRWGGGEGGGSVTGMNDAAYGMTSPGAAVAHMWRRYQHLYKPPEETLGYFAINNRANACLNPLAVMRTPITMDDYLNSRYVAEPLRLLDYCLINDGGVCLIVTTAERARDLKQTPTYIHASASCGDFNYQYTVDDFFCDAMASVANDLFANSDIQRRDIGALEIYDNFTPVILFTLEGMGFCPRGEGAAFVTPERISLGGELPINTSGGHTSESYMQGWGLLAESVRQIRGECGERQVANCEQVLYANAAPINSAIIFRK
jgi:acetyl-CoA acetyltransferase